MSKNLLSVLVLSMSAVLVTACGDDASESKVSEAVEETKVAVEEAAENTTEAVQDAGEAVQDATETAVDETAEAVDSAVASVEEQSAKIAAAADDAATEASTTIENTVSGGQSGADVYAGLCSSCHTTGVLEAPKLGNGADWAPRIDKGREALYASSINGIGMMPAKGGNSSLTDAEVKAAVDYMLSKVQ